MTDDGWEAVCVEKDWRHAYANEKLATVAAERHNLEHHDGDRFAVVRSPDLLQVLTGLQSVEGRLRKRRPIDLTLVALVLYGFYRLAAILFYGRLGVTPEDVGLSYGQTVTQAAFGLFFGAFALTIWSGVAWVGTAPGLVDS